MNPENTSKLLNAYPLLYRELRDRRFECGDGWFNLVWQVSAEIESAAQLEGIPKTAETWPSVGGAQGKIWHVAGAVPRKGERSDRSLGRQGWRTICGTLRVMRCACPARP